MQGGLRLHLREAGHWQREQQCVREKGREGEHGTRACQSMCAATIIDKHNSERYREREKNLNGGTCVSIHA